jgi:hypothetical protein
MVYDVDKGSRGIFGLAFYAVTSLVFCFTSFAQYCKMERSNPMVSILLFLFSGLNLASAVITFCMQETTHVSDLLMLISVAAMAFVIQRSVILILDQFKSTPSAFVHFSLYGVPAWIGLFAAVGTFQAAPLRLWLTVVPLGAGSVWVCAFSIVALYWRMEDRFGQIGEAFPNLGVELRRSRKYLCFSAVSFLPMTAVVLFNANVAPPIVGASLLMYYVMIGVVIFTMSTVGLSSDAIMSDLFAVEERPNDAESSLVTGGDDQLSCNSMSPMSPSQYLRSAETKYERRECCRSSLKFVAIAVVFVIVALVVALSVIRPTALIWTLDDIGLLRMSPNGSQIFLEPSVTVDNQMRIDAEIGYAVFEVYVWQTQVGRVEREGEVIRALSRTGLKARLDLNLGEILANGFVPPDGIVNLEMIIEARPRMLRVFDSHAIVRCDQGIRIVPRLEVTGRKGKCVPTTTEMLVDMRGILS